MQIQKFPIQIIDSFENIDIKTIVLEFRQTSTIVDIVSKLDFFDDNFFEILIEKHKDEKEIIFYPKENNIFQVICFFPDEKKLFDNRSEILRKHNKNVCYIPDGNIEDAFEIFTLATYTFDFYKTEKKENKRLFFVEDVSNNMSKLDKKKALLSAIIEARNLVNTPAQDANPESIVEYIKSYPWKHFDVQIFGDNALRELECNLIRAVGQGSVRESFMVIFIPKKEISGEKYAFIGKGVTFDAGGIQIKPGNGMLDMKCDMAGAAGILGVAMHLDSLEKLPVNAIFGIALAENMTGSAAFKPLDIFRAYNGKTVEIHHTDAEGRLVLADVMSYVEQNYKPDHITTMATLTGACIYALGNDTAGVMGDDEDFISTLIDNTSPYESVWRLPLPDSLQKALESDIADIKTLSDTEKAGSSLGGAFLSFFKGDAKFTHLDIAGPAFRTKPFGYMTAGGTGWGVKKLSEILILLGNQ